MHLIQVKNRAWSPSLLPFPSLRHVFYIVLYCTVLYCTVLYCTVLYCTVLYCTVLYCTVLYCTVLYCTVLYCTVLYCTVLYCTVLYCTVLYCTVLFCTVLFILQKLTCFESLTGRARLHPDTLLSLLRRSRDSLVFFESRLHAESSSHGCMTRNNEKMADESRNSGIHWTLDTALCCNTGQNNEINPHKKPSLNTPGLLYIGIFSCRE